VVLLNEAVKSAWSAELTTPSLFRSARGLLAPKFALKSVSSSLSIAPFLSWSPGVSRKGIPYAEYLCHSTTSPALSKIALTSARQFWA
jgi:hypothetical protein